MNPIPTKVEPSVAPPPAAPLQPVRSSEVSESIGFLDRGWKWVTGPWHQPPLQGAAWSGRFTIREWSMLLVSLAGLAVLLPPTSLAMLGAAAATVFAISGTVPGRNRRLLWTVPVILLFAVGINVFPRAAIPYVPSGRRALEAFFVLRIVEYALSANAADASLTIGQRIKRFALWLFFFPNLFLGPVYSHRDFFTSYRPGALWTIQRLVHAAVRIAVGAIKFRLIGPFVARLIAQIELAVTDATVTAWWERYVDVRVAMAAAMFLGLIQFYVIFSGFCDIATAICRLAGFDLYDNFENPLAATDPVQYWKRSNISTYRWLMHQIFFPFWGHTQVTAKTMTTFAVSGIWHFLWCEGANWSAASQILLGFFMYGTAVRLWMKWAPRLGANVRHRTSHAAWVNWLIHAFAIAANLTFLSLVHKVTWSGIAGKSWDVTLEAFSLLIFGHI